MRIPVTLAAEFRGLARKAGSFETEENGRTRKVDYTDAYKFETHDADGVLCDVVLSQKACDLAADFDSNSLKPGDRVTIAGVCADSTDGGGMYVKPLKLVKGDSVAKLQAA
jgi:hypothetical protein